MKDHLSTLGKQTLIYGISGTALQAVGLITLPIFARVFAPAEYGVLEIVTVGLAATLLVADLSLSSASQRSFFDHSDEESDERRSVLMTAIATALAMSLLLATVVYGLRDPLADWLFDGQAYTTILALAALSIPLTVLANMTREVMRLHFRTWHYAVSATVGAVVVGALGASLVLWTDAGVDGVLVGVVAGNAVAAIYGLVVVGRHAFGRLSRSKLRTMLAYGLPLVPAAAAMWGVAFLDRIMLSRLADLDDVGEYAVAARFSTVVMLGVTAFGLAFSPFLLSLWSKDPDAERRLRARVLTYLTAALAFISLLLGLFAREMILVIAPDFDQAHELVGVLCLGVTLFGVASVAIAGLTIVRRTGLVAVYSLGAVGMNALLALVLIPPLEGLGAGLAAAGGYAMLALGYYIHGQRLYPTPYSPGRTVAVLGAAAVLLPIGLLPLGLATFAVKLAAVGTFAGALVVFRIIGRAEFAELARVLRRAAPKSRQPTSPAASGH